MKKNILFQLLMLISLAGFSQNVKRMSVYFGKAESTVSAAEVVKLIDLKHASHIVLKGHTDNDADEKYNLQLSKERVDAVKNKLIALGISSKKIFTYYVGENSPLNDNRTEQEKSENRCVEVKFIKDPLMQDNKASEFFTINNSKDTTITGKEGTKIKIPANTFGFARNENIKIELKEYYDRADIIKANLTTSSNNKLLESAGMINITATNNRQPVTPKIPLTYMFPKNGNTKNDFKLFSGTKDENGNINWNLTRDQSAGSTDSMNLTATINGQQTMREMMALDLAHKRIDNNEQDIPTKVDEGKASKTDIDYYIYESLDMSFINCDRFADNTKERVPFIVETHPSANVKLVFTRVRGLLNSNVTNGKYVFSNVPLNEPVTIISTYYDGDKVYVAKLKTVISKTSVTDLKYELVTMKRLDDIINEI